MTRDQILFWLATCGVVLIGIAFGFAGLGDEVGAFISGLIGGGAVVFVLLELVRNA